MSINVKFPTRLPVNEMSALAEAQDLRSSAIKLRERVARGGYDEADFGEYLKILENYGMVLRCSSSELADEAGVGSSFASSALRDRRRPKFHNMLKIIDAVIRIASERLYDADRIVVGAHPFAGKKDSLNAEEISDLPSLLVTCRALENIARGQISELEEYRPNNPESIAWVEASLNVMRLFANGFERIAEAVERLLPNPSDELKRNQLRIITANVGDAVTEWWSNNKNDAVDWTIRIPAIATGIGVLGLAGANMSIATTSIISMVGGPKIISLSKEIMRGSKIK